MAYVRNPRRRVIRGSSSDELRRGGRRTSEEFDPDSEDMGFVRLGSSAVGTGQDVVQRIGDAIIGGDFSGNARGQTAIDIQVERGAATNVASGEGAVVFGRYIQASGYLAVAVGASIQGSADYSVGFGTDVSPTGYGAIAVGGEVTASGVNSIAVGEQIIASGVNAIAMGASVTASGEGAIAFGNGAYATEQGAIVFGTDVAATAVNAIAIGDQSTASGVNSLVIGENARASGIGAILIDLAHEGEAAGDGSIVLGAQGAAGDRAIAIGASAQSDVDDQAVVAGLTFKMQIGRLGWPTYAPIYESVITTSDAAPATGNVATFADVDRIGDGGVALSALAPLASPTFTGVVTLPAGGSLSAPVLIFAGDANTGLFQPSADRVVASANGQRSFGWDGASGVGRFGVFDTSGGQLLFLSAGSNLTADRVLTFTTGDADRTITLSGNLTVDGTTTISTAAATVLDDATVAAMVDTLGGASSVGSGGLARATSPVFATQISTPAIVTASGALTVTPAAGSGVAFVLSTTGDFSVNTDRICVDTSTGYVGLGTAIPAAKVDMVVDGLGMVVRRYNGSAAAGFYRAQGSEASPTQVTIAGTIGAFAAYGLDDTGVYRSVALIRYNNDGAITSTDSAGSLVFQTTSAGSTTSTTKAILTSAGFFGFLTTVPTHLVSLGGNTARTMWMERHTTANTAGNTLTVQAGGATSGATDKAGGDLLLKPGDSTGSAESGVQIFGVVAGASGTADRTQTKAIQVLGNKIGFYAVTPVVRPTALTAALTALTHTAPGTPDYALQNLTAGGYGFVTADEGNTMLTVLVRTALRLGEVETKLQALGLLT